MDCPLTCTAGVSTECLAVECRLCFVQRLGLSAPRADLSGHALHVINVAVGK